MIEAGKLRSTASVEVLGRFHRVPVRMGRTGRKMTPSARAIAGEVSTYSPKENPNASCRMTYTHAQETFGVTRTTVSDSLEKLVESGIIELSGRDAKGTSYRFITTRSGKFVVVPEYLYTATLGTSAQRLTKSQVLILAYLMTESKRKQNAGVYEGSAARIAWELNLSQFTTKKALRVFLRNELIFRPAEEKGKNSHKLSVYHVNRRLFDYQKYTKKKVKKEQKAEKTYISEDVKNANARSERERYYAKAQDLLTVKAEKYREKAYETAPRLVEIDREIAKLQPTLARAELRDGEQLPVLRAKEGFLRKERAALMARFGIEEHRFQAKFYAGCKNCFDTGYGPNGAACDCYLQRRRE